jgi:hypothetical protein
MSDLLTRKHRRSAWLMLGAAGLTLIGAPRGHEGTAGRLGRAEEVNVEPGEPLVAPDQVGQGPPHPPELEPDLTLTFLDAWKQDRLSGLTRKAACDLGHAALHAAKEPHTHPEPEEPAGRSESESSGPG